MRRSDASVLKSSLAVSVVLLGAGMVGGACSSSSSTPGTGGSGTAGAGTGGRTTGSGGAAGGATGTGGRVGTGGATAVGGTTGTGGADVVGTGGVAGMGCPNVAPYTHVSAFGTIFDGWMVAPNSSGSLVPVMAMNDAGPSGTIQELDATQGSPTNGSVKLTIPFSSPGQQLLFASNSAGLNLSGTTITAQIKLDSGLSTSPVNTGQAYLVVKSTVQYIYAQGPIVNLDSTAGWVTLTLSADMPGPMIPFGYTPCDIREIDVVIQTGPTGDYVPAVVHIDTIAISLPGGATPDGGVGGATGGTGAGGSTGGTGVGGSTGGGGAGGARVDAGAGQ